MPCRCVGVRCAFSICPRACCAGGALRAHDGEPDVIGGAGRVEGGVESGADPN